jgi:hypothetical protein
MIRYGFLFFAGLMFIGGAAAQSNPEAAQSDAQVSALPTGAAIRATFSSSIDSKKLKQGDKVTAETNAETKMGDKIVMPRGAKLVGHVTHAAARSKGDAYSSVGIVFDKALLKHNQEIPLNVTIEALASAPQSAMSAAPDMGLSPSPGAPGGGSMAGRPGAPSTAPPPSANNSSNVENTIGNTDTNNASAGKGAVGGLDNSGMLTPQSRGVFGLQGIGLAAGTLGAEPGTVITSTGKEVRLDSGTQLLLITQAVQAAK